MKPIHLFAVLNQAGRVIESPRIAFYHILALIVRDRLPEARDTIRNAVRDARRLVGGGVVRRESKRMYLQERAGTLDTRLMVNGIDFVYKQVVSAGVQLGWEHGAIQTGRKKHEGSDYGDCHPAVKSELERSSYGGHNLSCSFQMHVKLAKFAADFTAVILKETTIAKDGALGDLLQASAFRCLCESRV